MKELEMIGHTAGTLPEMARNTFYSQAVQYSSKQQNFSNPSSSICNFWALRHYKIHLLYMGFHFYSLYRTFFPLKCSFFIPNEFK